MNTIMSELKIIYWVHESRHLNVETLILSFFSLFISHSKAVLTLGPVALYHTRARLCPLPPPRTLSSSHPSLLYPFRPLSCQIYGVSRTEPTVFSAPHHIVQRPFGPRVSPILPNISEFLFPVGPIFSHLLKCPPLHLCWRPKSSLKFKFQARTISCPAEPTREGTKWLHSSNEHLHVHLRHLHLCLVVSSCVLSMSNLGVV